jgi:small GTP-binding protein
MRSNQLVDDKMPKKLLIMGLDNSGKTSIALCLKGIKNLLSFVSLTPTRGIKTETFEALQSKFNVWDFGGQEAFRADYLNNFENYVEGTNKIIFVIDIQDLKRFDIALNYLEKVINLLRGNKNEIDFSIFLHKCDPDLQLYNSKFNFQDVDDLVEKIRSILPNGFKYSIHKTSIYTVFEKTDIGI